MSLNGIDIASYQAGLQIAKVPMDFVIIKATGGTGYVNQYCDGHYQQAKAAGKLRAVYHYAHEIGYQGTPEQEAAFFLQNIKGYIGDCIMVLDWESDNKTDVAWAKRWLDYVYKATGIKPLFYTYTAVLNSANFSAIANADYGLWLANYGANQVQGYSKPNPPATPYWPFVTMYQFTSNGSLPGWGGRLDLNVFYGDAAAWNAYAGKKKPTPPKPPKPTIKQGTKDPVKKGLAYRVHIPKQGDLGWVTEGKTAGTTGKGIPIQAVDIRYNGAGDLITGKAHVQSLGWQPWDYDTTGTKGKGKNLEAIQLWPGEYVTHQGYGLTYRVHVAKIGWQPWKKDGEIAGTTGKNLAIEAIEIKLYKK